MIQINTIFLYKLNSDIIILLLRLIINSKTSDSFIFPRNNHSTHNKRISYDKQPVLNTINEEVNIINGDDHANNKNNNNNIANNKDSDTYRLCHKLLDFSMSRFKGLY